MEIMQLSGWNLGCYGLRFKLDEDNAIQNKQLASVIGHADGYQNSEAKR